MFQMIFFHITAWPLLCVCAQLQLYSPLFRSFSFQGTIKLLSQIGQDTAIAEQQVKIVQKQLDHIQKLRDVSHVLPCQINCIKLRNSESKHGKCTVFRCKVYIVISDKLHYKLDTSGSKHGKCK